MLRENRDLRGSHPRPSFRTMTAYPLSSPPQHFFFFFLAILGWCRPEWLLCSLPGLEVMISHYISVEEGSGCRPVPVPAFLWPAWEMSPSAQMLPSLGGAKEGEGLQCLSFKALG